MERGDRFDRPRRGDGDLNPEMEQPATPRRRREQSEQVQATLLSLLAEMEAIVESGTSIPFTSRVMIDRDLYLDAMEAMRLAIPEAVVQAERIVRDKERIVAQADAEAERVLSLAKEKAAFLVSERQLLRSAEIQSNAILETAHDEAKEILSSAQKYASDLLAQVENETLRVLGEIRKASNQIKQNVE